MVKILNIAAGKIDPIDLNNYDNYFVVNVDTMYYSVTPPEIIEEMYFKDVPTTKVYSNEDIFTFIERTKLLFDNICIYRFLEHISMNNILYFIYLISTCTKKGAKIDVIVPNYEILARLILAEMVYNNSNFEKENVILTTELLNEKNDPHCSIWTPNRMCYFWELENRFKIKDLTQSYIFDGRNIYLRALIERL